MSIWAMSASRSLPGMLSFVRTATLTLSRAGLPLVLWTVKVNYNGSSLKGSNYHVWEEEESLPGSYAGIWFASPVLAGCS